MFSSTSAIPMKNNVAYNSDSESDGQARGGRRPQNQLSQAAQALPKLPTSVGLAQPAGKIKHILYKGNGHH